MLQSDSLTKDVCLSAKKNSVLTSNSILNKLKNNFSIQKPKLVSVGTQSPKFTSDVPCQTIHSIKQTTYSTPHSTEAKIPQTFYETPKTTAVKHNINLVPQTQAVNPSTDITKKDLSKLLFSDNNASVFPTSNNSDSLNSKQQITASQSPIRTSVTNSPSAVTSVKNSTTDSSFIFKPMSITTAPKTDTTTTKFIDIKSTKTETDLILKNQASTAVEFTFNPATTTVTTLNTAISSPIVNTVIPALQPNITTTTQSIITPKSSIATTPLNNTKNSLNFIFKPATSIVSNVTSTTISNVMPSLFSSNPPISNVTLTNNANTTPSINFTFKPPNDIQSGISTSQPGQNDVGMDDDIGNNMLNNSVTFDFNK